MKPYNLIYIHTHDTGRGIQPYDPGISTPNLMELARRGILFRQAYCCGPTCSPSRCGLLTGEYPHQNGMLGLAHRGFGLKDYHKHLARFLKSNGYETALFGMQHEAASADVIGYDRVFIEPKKEGKDRDLWDVRNGKKAITFLTEHQKEAPDTPFFLSYGLEYTHKPYPDVLPEIDPLYLKVPSCLPDTPETRRDYAGFLTSVKRADQCIGAVLDAIERLGLYENSIVLFTTDHGIALPHMKCTLYDAGVGVACILCVPGMGAHRVSDALISQLDLYPTFCDLLEIPRPAWLQGYSLMPLITGEKEEIREAVFAEINYHAAREPQRMVRTKRYKYIRFYGARRHYAPCNIDGGESKDFLVRCGLLEFWQEEELLYDLMLDPQERNNVAHRPEYRNALELMRDLLDQHMKRTGDSIAENGLETVPGMILNKETCYDADSTDASDYEEIERGN